MRPSSLLPVSLLALVTRGNASHLRLSGQYTASPMPGALVNDSQDIAYTTSLALNGQLFSVVVDTGSSDLWVKSDVPGAVSQNYTVTVQYGKGSAPGRVKSATLDFAGYSIENQYYMYAPNGTSAGSATGLLGVGPGSGSGIRRFGNTSAANQPFDNIFTSNSSISPMLGILLQRSNDPDEPFPGYLSIGEALPQYQSVLNQPQLPVALVTSGIQHWQALLDVNGITNWQGKPIEFQTNVTGAKTTNATVFFDTGMSISQVPAVVAEALYGDIPGAVLTNISDGQVYALPCDQEVNATFYFGGVPIPIHPLDMNMRVKNNQGDYVCLGGFQPVKDQTNGQFDMGLGMSFMRNVYFAVNWGDLVNATAPNTTTAYIQLLPTTNATKASFDFAQVRASNGTSSGNTTTSKGKGNSASTGASVDYHVTLLFLLSTLMFVV